MNVNYPRKTVPIERSLLAAAIRRLRKLGWEFRKRHGDVFGKAGDPDLYGVYGGVHWEMELKTPGKEPTVLQSLRLKSWEKVGAVTFVVHTIDELERALQAVVILAGRKNPSR